MDQTRKSRTGPKTERGLGGGGAMSDLAFQFPNRWLAKSRRSEAQAGERGSRRSVSIAPTREPRRDAGPTAVARPV